MSVPTDFLEQQADLLFDNLSGWESRTLERIAKRIKRTGKMNLADVKSLNNMAVVKQEMDAIIKDLAQVTGQNITQIQKIYGDVINQQHENNKYLYDYRNKPFVPFSDNIQLQTLAKAYSKTTGETMINLSKTKALGFIDEIGGFKNMQDSIYDAFGKATMQVATGSSDFTTAMRGVIEQMGNSGIRVHYGSGVNRRLDTVVRQNLLWGAKQASVEYNNAVGEELNCDGIEIDFHSNPRPSHEFMQGMQYSLHGKKTVNGRTYESADRALERLEDYGCLHFKTPIILGVSEPRYSAQELAEMRQENNKPKTVDGVEKSGYEWTQNLRKLETEARKEKEIINSLKAMGDEEGARQHRRKLRAINEKYGNICDQTGLTPQKDRMRVYGGTKVAKNPTKKVANIDNGGIIKEMEDSPRKMIKGDFAVDWSKIHSAQYRERLSSISKDDKVLDAINTRARWALNNREGVKTEELYAINLNDGSEVSKIIDQHFEFRVERTEKFTRELNFADSKGHKILLIHNHPRGLPPSIGDINALFDNENVSGITIGHDGSIYHYTRPSIKIEEDDWHIALKHFNKHSEITAMEKALEILSKKYQFTLFKL